MSGGGQDDCKSIAEASSCCTGGCTVTVTSQNKKKVSGSHDSKQIRHYLIIYFVCVRQITLNPTRTFLCSFINQPSPRVLYTITQNTEFYIIRKTLKGRKQTNKYGTEISALTVTEDYLCYKQGQDLYVITYFYINKDRPIF